MCIFARTCVNTVCFSLAGHEESKLLSREVQSLLTALLVLLSVYIAGICIIFIILSKVSQVFLRCRDDPTASNIILGTELSTSL